METSRDLPEIRGVAAPVTREVGVAHSSVEASVMERGAKGPYLVNVNREAKDVRWLPSR
jgi:hypothetical protein